MKQKNGMIADEVSEERKQSYEAIFKRLRVLAKNPLNLYPQNPEIQLNGQNGEKCAGGARFP
ncbi:hypothetical protein NECAME_00419 [Necator americanus]|uniref:Uncharacterized protein n=1 Tax=Necator americanus TaxID=51031 RepID=W2TDE7_NECAM|nr:hypothetical protein NECAME_00419 [Necator americanus]ETN79042.1 hypothetical protein NECAME_00419 [Necator americanus]